MKKLVPFIAILFAASFASAQQLGDGSFETKWKLHAETGRSDWPSYWDYSQEDEDDLIRTLNSLTDLNIGEFVTEPTAFREENDVKDGNYAIRVRTASFSNVLLVPGVFGTISNDYVEEYLDQDNGGWIGVTSEFNFIPEKLEGYYKYAPVNGDSGVIEIALYNEDLVIASGKLMLYNTVSEWTKFEIDVVNTLPGAQATDLRMLFISSAGYNFDDLETCQGQVGSTLWIDDVKFNYEPSLTESIMPDLNVKTFPNPASESVTFQFDQTVQGKLVIYTIAGAEVASFPIDRERMDVNISNWAAGTYLFRVIDNNSIKKSGKFTKVQ